MSKKLVDKLHSARIKKDNEFYTTKLQIDNIMQLTTIPEYLKDKIVYLPCDSEQSKILQHLQTYKDIYGIKEILHTCDDMYGHLDLYEKCDVVFTNPPFTGWTKYVKFLESLNKKWILFVGMMTIWGSIGRVESQGRAKTLAFGRRDNDITTNKFLLKGTKYDDDYAKVAVQNYEIHCIKDFTFFEKPDGSKKSVGFFIMSNDDFFENIKIKIDAKKTFKELLNEGKIYYNEQYNKPQIDNSIYFPIDYDGEIIFPAMAAIGRQHYFEWIEPIEAICKDDKYRSRVIGKLKDTLEKQNKNVKKYYNYHNDDGTITIKIKD